jgi:hypothetical protein
MVPALMLGLERSMPGMTIQVRCLPMARLELAVTEMRWRTYLWINRRNAHTSRPGIALFLQSSAAAWDEATVSDWLHGNPSTFPTVPSRGLVHGIQKAKGLLGMSFRPEMERLELVLVLPTT